MSHVHGKDTTPEIRVRKLVFSMGYRYRLYRRDLPGSPDIVFPGKRKVIFVHGCYWHGHECRGGRLSKSNVEFWRAKIERNRERDAENERRLRDLGWDVLIVWQCELKDEGSLTRELGRFLASP